MAEIGELSEQAVLLGPRQSLVGIVTEIVPPKAAARTGIVILNTGIIHRVGHHRMYVTMSRRLAATGNIVLRFDFSGVGDSDSSSSGLPPLPSNLADITEALDWLTSMRSLTRVILVGLCSGADHAILYGCNDTRVVGLVLIDPSIPPTARYYVHYIGRRLMRFRSWLSVPLGRSGLLRMMMERFAFAIHPRWEPQHISLQNPGIHSYLERVYQRSIAQGIEILAIFTGQSFRQTYREQLLDAFPNVKFGEQLRLEYFEHCDHTFAFDHDRNRLTRVLMDWLSRTSFRDEGAANGSSERCVVSRGSPSAVRPPQ
jgi:pimeloyl-ACP methyl ester carboxylesterase